MDAAYYRQEVINIGRGIIEGMDPEDMEREDYSPFHALRELERRAGPADHGAFIAGLASVIEEDPDVAPESQLNALEFAGTMRKTETEIVAAIIALHQKIPMDLEYEDTDPPPANWLIVELRRSLISYVNLVADYLRTELALPYIATPKQILPPHPEAIL